MCKNTTGLFGALFVVEGLRWRSVKDGDQFERLAQQCGPELYCRRNCMATPFLSFQVLVFAAELLWIGKSLSQFLFHGPGYCGLRIR